ncbi:MAG: sugar transferase [Deltaproteobacteria bacterium]|nr:sugar transferase [Deltaproteobacteria bacterium]MBW1987390.1 sugar transferase [Deltaproteobacteria bacterium]MBW2135173.1 sugar transferase [Deltaproteobacteria bacterium]
MKSQHAITWKFKRWLDLSLAFIGLMVSSPLFILISILIRLDSPGPVFFRQERVGQNGQIFRVWKFRTMVCNAEFIGPCYSFIENDPRITWVGKVLRYLSLDELPQLFNIIKGEMSLVGPRATLPYQAERYNDFQKKRLAVKPGITGWAQINGRNDIPWSQRFIYDVWYVEHWSLMLDLKIIFSTIPMVLRRQGVRMNQNVTEVEDF